MDSSLKIISKQFGFKIRDKRKYSIHFSVSKAFKAAARLSKRPEQRQPELPVPGALQAVAFPPEIFDHIIDYLYDDIEALRNCSLVCHALTPSARFHLFNRVTVTEKNFTRAITIFAQDAPDLALYVRDLTLAFPGTLVSTLSHLHMILNEQKTPVLLRVFMLILSPRMPNVLRLTFKHMAVDRSIVAMLAPIFPHLHTLSMFDCWFSCNADFYTILRDHPTIRHLCCGRLSSLYGNSTISPLLGGFENVVPQQATDLGSPWHLQTLKISEAYPPSPLTLTPWVVMHSNPQLYTYTLYRLGQITMLNQGLLQLPSVKHLHVVFYKWRFDELVEVTITPAMLTLLPRHPPTITTLTIDAKMHSMHLAVTVLSQLDSHAFVYLQTLNVLMHLLEEDILDVSSDCWAAMDQTLSVLLSLGAVNVFNVCDDLAHCEAGEDAIRARLPVLGARGLLRFNQKHAFMLQLQI